MFCFKEEARGLLINCGVLCISAWQERGGSFINRPGPLGLPTVEWGDRWPEAYGVDALTFRRKCSVCRQRALITFPYLEPLFEGCPEASFVEEKTALEPFAVLNADHLCDPRFPRLPTALRTWREVWALLKCSGVCDEKWGAWCAQLHPAVNLPMEGLLPGNHSPLVQQLSPFFKRRFWEQAPPIPPFLRRVMCSVHGALSAVARAKPSRPYPYFDQGYSEKGLQIAKILLLRFKGLTLWTLRYLYERRCFLNTGASQLDHTVQMMVVFKGCRHWNPGHSSSTIRGLCPY